MSEYKKEDLRIRRTKKGIKDAFLELLEKKSIDDITISEIAKIANVNRKTFYRHYPTKYQIVEDIINDALNDLIFELENDHYFSSNLSFYDVMACMVRAAKKNNNEKLFVYLRGSMYYQSVTERASRFLTGVFIAKYPYKKSYMNEELFNEFVYYIVYTNMKMFILWYRGQFNMSLEEFYEYIKKFSLNFFRKVAKF